MMNKLIIKEDIIKEQILDDSISNYRNTSKY